MSGEGGAGESVWLGFFLHDTLCQFADLAAERERRGQAEPYRQQRRAALRARLDGMWHDDRYPRLVASNGDAISWFDALMGSWPVLSGAVGFERGRAAVEAALGGLERDHQVLLLTPWFGEHSPRVPGQDRRLSARRAREWRPVFARLVLAGRRAGPAVRHRRAPTVTQKLALRAARARGRDLVQDLAARQDRRGAARHLRSATAPAARRHLLRPGLRGPRRLELVHRCGGPNAHRSPCVTWTEARGWEADGSAGRL